MTCEFNNGLKVSYCGKLRIKRGNEINVFLDQDEIPPEIRGELHEAAIHDSCNELKYIAEEVTDLYGTNLPEEG